MKYTHIIAAMFFSACALSTHCSEKELKEKTQTKIDSKKYTGVMKRHSFKQFAYRHLTTPNIDRKAQPAETTK